MFKILPEKCVTNGADKMRMKPASTINGGELDDGELGDGELGDGETASMAAANSRS
jgi:hypothetical protein